MNTKLENEINSEDEMNLYDYWEVLVKRKKVFIGIFLIPLVIVTIISFSVPRYYRGEVEIINPVLPAPNIVNLIGHIDDTKKAKIFTNKPGAIKSALILLPKKSTDKLNIVIDAKTPDIIPQAFKDIFNYISSLPEIKGEIARIKEEIDFKMKNLVKARKANRLFLKAIPDMMKRKQTLIILSPADFIMKDYDQSVEIMTLQRIETVIMKRKIKVIGINLDDLSKKDDDQSSEVMNLQKADMNLQKADMNLQKVEETLGLPVILSITVQPSNSQIRKIIISTGALSLVTAIFVVFFLLDYIERIKARENK